MIFRNAGVPCGTCGGKPLPVFRFARNLVQKKRARGSLLLSLLWRELENGKRFSAACFAGDPQLDEKIKKSYMYGTGTRGTQVPVQVQVPVKTSNQFLKNNLKKVLLDV